MSDYLVERLRARTCTREHDPAEFCWGCHPKTSRTTQEAAREVAQRVLDAGHELARLAARDFFGPVNLDLEQSISRHPANHPAPSPQVHELDGQVWASCGCGWTSSSDSDLAEQVRAHRRIHGGQQ